MATPATQFDDRLPRIVLVGRVNVGKSTLFNRLIEDQKAIVSIIPGTTRTSNEGIIAWRGKQTRLIDTGGLTFTDDVLLEADIIRQTEIALSSANIILFVTDGKNGLLPQEFELAKRLWKYKDSIPTIVLANKIDNTQTDKALNVRAYGKLSLGKPFVISAANGRNVGDLLDLIYKTLAKGSVRPKIYTTKSSLDCININIVGKPNVGKSSLFNKLIGEDRVIVSDMAHTTREPHDTLVTYVHTVDKKRTKQQINFVDTAGIRRKAKVSGILERQGVGKSIQSATDADMILLVLDGTEDISHQDQQLGGFLEKHAKSVVILINKWDLAEDNTDNKRNEVKKMIYKHFPHLDFAPILFVSGLTGYKVQDIFPLIMKIWKGRHTKIPEKKLEVFLKQATSQHRPSRGKGTRHPDVLSMRQINVAPPVFEIVIKFRTSLHRSYISYLENQLREKFDFTGTPIIIKLVKQKR